jgi:diguanylate cyclase (GGDEF)-like protein/PAS domain S-box-containing protein
MHPPFYLTWWAYTFYLLLIGGLLTTIYVQKHNKNKILLASNRTLKENEERLQLALSGSDSGLWDWQSRTNKIYEPRAQGLIDSSSLLIDFDQKLKLIHPDDRNKFIRKWHAFMEGENRVFDIVYRMKSLAGDWRWYRDMARVTATDDYTSPTRVTGTFTDITERKATRDKMFLFYEAFENTRDIIVILDSDYKVIAVNHAFYNITGLNENEVLQKNINFITQEEDSGSFTEKLKNAMAKDRQCESEGQLVRRFQDALPVLINATQFENDEHETFYVVTITDISDQKAAQENLARMANYDNLTGLPNRALLLDRITHAIEHSQRREAKIAVCFVDLDRFKQINDSLGHEAGDKVLIHTAELLKSCVRQDDTVARLGGDEFVIVLEDFKSLSIIQNIFKLIIDKMRAPLKLGSHEVTVSPSIGIAIYPDDGNEPEVLLKHADIAMYHAKNLGRNNYQFFKTEMNQEAQRRLSMENWVRNALNNREFYLEFQPQVELATGLIKGFEALARWKDHEGTVIPPSDFIPISEELGLIVPMTEQFIEEAMALANEWRQANLNAGIAINLSARNLQTPSLLKLVRENANRYQFNPGVIEFEITESLLMADLERSMELMHAMNELGIHFALDDFGTGYSSLKYLYELPINKIKIDRSFVWQLGVKPQSEAIIRTILSLSQSLNLTTVVEGVETALQLDQVSSMEADYVQGYYYSKPVSRDKATEMLISQAAGKAPFKPKKNG